VGVVGPNWSVTDSLVEERAWSWSGDGGTDGEIRKLDF